MIKSFDLPANDPAGGIHLTLDTTITNVSLKVGLFPRLFNVFLGSRLKLEFL